MAQIFVPSQYSTIQAAITACSSGDEIIVSAGLYTEVLVPTSKNNILIRAVTGDLVRVMDTGAATIVSLPTTCHHISFQGITFVRSAGVATGRMITSASAAVRSCKFTDCTFDFSGYTGPAAVISLLFLYPGDANSPTVVRRCTFIGNGAESYYRVIEFATAGASDQNILIESNLVRNFYLRNGNDSYVFYLNAGASNLAYYVVRNNTFLNCKVYRCHVSINGGFGSYGLCYNNVIQNSTFWNSADANALFRSASNSINYCAYNTAQNNVVSTNLASPNTSNNVFTAAPGLDTTTGIPTSATSPAYKSGVALSGNGERRVMLSQGRLPYSTVPSRGAFETWYTPGKGLLHVKWKNIAPMSSMSFNMTGQAAPTLPTTLRSFETPMEVAEYVERAIQPTKGLEYGPIEFFYDLNLNRYRAACYMSTFALSCAGGSAALFGSQSLTGQTDTG